jgi:hypothetical protein
MTVIDYMFQLLADNESDETPDIRIPGMGIS